MKNNYPDAIALAEKVSDLVHSEFWGTVEDTMPEEVEYTTAVTAYAIQTGFRLHETRETLLQVIHLEASDYDASPQEHKTQALECLHVLPAFEANHSKDYRLQDLACQVFKLAHKQAGHDFYYPVRQWDVERAIATGERYEELVTKPLLALEQDSPYIKALLSDVLARLEPFEARHRESRVA